MDAAVIALIGTLFGGAGLKLIEHWLSKSQVRSNDATQMRTELRQEMSYLRDEIKELEDERDKYRNEYYALMEKYIAQQKEFNEALQRFRAETEIATIKAEELAATPPIVPES